MLRQLLAVTAAGTVTSVASASTFQYEFTADLVLQNATDTELLDGATLTLTADFDGSGGWGSLFGVPSLVAEPGTSVFSISGSGNAANNTSGPTDEDIYYSATGVSSSAAGGFSDLFLGGIAGTLGSGSGFSVQAFFLSASGASGVAPGDAVLAEHFTTGPLTIFGTGSIFTASGGEYQLANPRGTLIPAPGAAALIGLAGTVGLRRRR